MKKLNHPWCEHLVWVDHDIVPMWHIALPIGAWRNNHVDSDWKFCPWCGVVRPVEVS